MLCTRLGIDVPIVQAPMGGAVGPQLAAAVSNAGGLGTLPLWYREIPELRRIVTEMRALTARPFAVNLNLQYPQEERLAACLEEGVPIISFFWREPGPLVARAKAGGALVMQTVASAEEARRAVGNGADILVAQGWEAGGHVRGMVSTLVLVPAVVDAADGTPVVAAGGIADGRGLAAVLALGAAGAWIGTRFLAAEEAEIHPYYQRRLLDAVETDTAWLPDLFDAGWPEAPHRVLRNSTIDAWDAAGHPPTGRRPGAGEVVAHSASEGDILRYQAKTAAPDMTGDIEALPLWAGQGVGLVRKVQPAAEIVREINAAAEQIFSARRS